MCKSCGSYGQGAEGRLISCVQCGQCYHTFCAGVKVYFIILHNSLNLYIEIFSNLLFVSDCECQWLYRKHCISDVF